MPVTASISTNVALTPAPHNPESEAQTDAGSPKAFVRSIHEELAERTLHVSPWEAQHRERQALCVQRAVRHDAARAVRGERLELDLAVAEAQRRSVVGA